MENKPTFFKKYLSSVIVILVIIAAILIIVFVRPKKTTSPATSDQNQSPTAVLPTASVPSVSTPTVPVPVSPSSLNSSNSIVTTETTPSIVFNSTSAVPSSNNAVGTTGKGLFKIFFQVDANAHDTYISDSCHTNLTDDGVSFSIVQNGQTNMTNVSGQDCILMPAANIVKTASGQFRIPAYASASFELVVSYQPATKGSYQLKINQVGYAPATETGTKLISISATNLAKLETNALGL